MGRREILKMALIEDAHINLKKENRQRALNKAQSELLISQQERDIKRIKKCAHSSGRKIRVIYERIF